MRVIFTTVAIFMALQFFGQATTTYTSSSSDFPNPSRGFYTHRETFGNASNNVASPLTLADIQDQRTTKNITLILRIFYLDKFRTSNISAGYLTGIQNDLNTIRSAGAKAILRFAYNNTITTHRHTSDAQKAQVLTHIGQLKSMLQSNADVILSLQLGFIGTWGEWFYTSTDFTNVTPAGSPNYANRKAVSDSLLKVMTVDKNVQIRTPYYKYNSAMYGNGSSGAANAIQLAQAFNGTDKSRIGHHNDCFLAAADDWGTYIDLVNDKAYLEQDTKYTINGGETCNNDITYTNCTNAQSELSRFHFTYLNNDYNATVLGQWTTDGCFNTIKQKLGYRLELVDGTFTNTASQSFAFDINLNLRNVGYAAPVEKKIFEFILKNNSTSTEYKVAYNDIDNRYWLPGTNYNITKQIGIGTLPNGSYNLYLAIKDTGTNITNNNLYNIQLANTGVWETATGYNLLKVVTVNNAINPGTGAYTGANWFGTSSTLSTTISSFTAKNMDNKANLKWTVLQDNDVDFYDIQRSNDGLNYFSVGKQMSTGYNGTTTYTFTDVTELKSANTYYRIALRLKSNMFKYSQIESVKKKNYTIEIVNIYPIPAGNNINIVLHAEKNNIANLNIYNSNGALVLQKRITVTEGVNQINDITIQNLNSGIYYIKIIADNTIATTKLIKK